MNTSDLVQAFSAPTVVVANRGSEFRLPADGWVQLFPYADVPAPIGNPDGREVEIVQVLDAAAAEAVVASIRRETERPNSGGVLVDFEHFSLDPEKESRAAMWIDEAQQRADGVWVKPRVTNSGRAALEGGDYRYISPVFDFPARTYRSGERVRPTGLYCAGLTNDPRIKGGVPLSNRHTAATAARSENQTIIQMKTLLKTLGLAEDATEESAVAAVQKIQNRATTAETGLAALQAEHGALLDTQIEATLEKHRTVVKNRDAWKARLKADYRGTVELLEGLAIAAPEKPDAPRLTNRQTAKTPAKNPRRARRKSRTARPRSSARKAPAADRMRTRRRLRTPSARRRRFKARSQRPEDRSQRPEDRSQRPEDRSQRPEDRSQRPEDRSQRPEDRSQRPEARSQSPNRQKPKAGHPRGSEGQGLITYH